ncbi:MFS transporter [Rasiella sp. SM2506]|uniref:MFS transporter n=1 Tax=Rasiella sp. SM2506 TaxID=3423914 RepID=UPI003D7AD9F0
MLPKRILTIIVFAQFCCTSLWFAGNGVLAQLTEAFQLPIEVLGYLTSAVQFGFILGTLIFALLTIADRFSPSKVFFICALFGATINLGMLWGGNTLASLLTIRFMTGFFLAGIYPIGMKIAADYFEKGLGKSLGYLVGALVVGTAFPHFVNTFSAEISWKWVIGSTSTVASLGGLLLLLLVPNGPYRKAASKLDFSILQQIFKNKNFRGAAFGYFGHMWELYAFWVFVPFILEAYTTINYTTEINVPFWSFLIIGIGSLGCIAAGYFSESLGSKKVATIALLVSGICCLVSPLFFTANSWIFLAFLLFWSSMIIADSPMFSTLVAQNTSPTTKGTALTIVNCIGFALSIISIQLVSYLTTVLAPQYLFVVLGLGSVFGLISLRLNINKSDTL